VTRTVTRYGREDTGFDFAAEAFGIPTGPELGTRRAGAAALLTPALPGSVYVYQGEELGLPGADILPDRIQDPVHHRSGGTDPGRDGCRVPIPRAADEPYCGFGSRTGPGSRSPSTGRRTPSTGRPPTRTRCSPSTARPCGCGVPRSALVTAP
jgi:alpha-glucosidase